MGFSYSVAPGDLLWVQALFDLATEFRAGTADLSAAYEQFGNLFLPDFTTNGASGPITGQAYFKTPDTAGIQYPGGSYDLGELPLSHIIGFGINKVVNGVPISETWIFAEGLDLTFLELFSAPSVEAMERLFFAGDDQILYTAAPGSPDQIDDVLHGRGGDDTFAFYGSGGSDSLYGDGGNDRVSINLGSAVAGAFFHGYGGDGNDTLLGNALGDALYGGNGGDQLAGNGGDDLTAGGAGGDAVNAGEGADTLLGGGGADSLIGGLGQDMLTGGPGADYFIFTFRASTGVFDSGKAVGVRDEIVDFTQGQDFFRVVDLAGGALTLVGQGPFTAANQLRWVSSGGNTTVFLNADADVATEMAVTLTGVTGLTAGDFSI